MIKLTIKQARRFMLYKQGLLGSYRFVAKAGALLYIEQAGCIQFDPVDCCGKNAELVLQSRVRGFSKKMLQELLYNDRLLVDYPDKQLSIIPVSDWPYFARYRKLALDTGKEFEGLSELETYAKSYIREHGPVSSDELPLEGEIFWHSAIHWSGNWHGKSKAARSVLEQLYSTGELLIHHKEGTRKYYDLTEKYLDTRLITAQDPLPDEHEHRKWRVLRRIGAVGLLWNRQSDAWLNISGFTPDERNAIFTELEAEGKILPIQVEGIRSVLYCRAEDRKLLDEACADVRFTPRCELIAPLDCMMWDRKLIEALFGFSYSWEIYTPPEKRRYGYYTLPVIYGDRFIGRTEIVCDRKNAVMELRHFWPEDAKLPKAFDAAFDKCLARFAKFNGCVKIVRAEGECEDET